ncbi:unnamed protein product [Pleuronectes platessa]|uniref:Uncharacterized protein n=1 Tax=Pleuronectes platessa TaxID=8262 RepID=A0A9N7VVV8_PLEPL|nr:unnamed protein product [Pleuronectes platessa]
MYQWDLDTVAPAQTLAPTATVQDGGTYAITDWQEQLPLSLENVCGLSTLASSAPVVTVFVFDSLWPVVTFFGFTLTALVILRVRARPCVPSCHSLNSHLPTARGCTESHSVLVLINSANPLRDPKHSSGFSSALRTSTLCRFTHVRPLAAKI